MTTIAVVSDPVLWGMMIVGFACLAFWIQCVVRVAQEKTEDPLDRIVWLLIVLLLNVLGAALYVAFGPQAKEDQQRAKIREQEADSR